MMNSQLQPQDPAPTTHRLTYDGGEGSPVVATLPSPERSPQDIVATLKAKGLRVTPQRCAVYANLLTRTDHPTVEQILGDLNRDLPVSSKATVYTSLQALREVGLVREVLLEEGVSRYDANMQRHHHFRCECCGTIEDVAWEVFGQADLSQLRPGLQAQSYEVTISGLCAQCAAQAQ